ncbi:MAG TPA: tetratricopeptide repeat protein [Polyangia bacterium]|nr:tetratricopeptide repeat protein [Polyangia bacterium]
MIQRGEGNDEVDDRALWAEARLDGLPPEAIRRVRARLFAAVQAPARVWRLPSLATAVVLLLVGGLAGGSMTTLVIRARAREATPTQRDVAKYSPGQVRHPTRGPQTEAAATAAPPPVEPSAPPPPETATRIAPRPARAAPSPAVAVAVPARTTAPPPDPIAVEANLLGAALQALRQNNAPAQALALLDEYAARFPAGALSSEATLARVDSLRRLKRDETLRRLLEEQPIDRLPRARELRVLRGELRLGAGQARQAAADFDAALATSVDDALAARALYGRAGCRAQLGDRQGARADLRLYVTRFPDGPRAAELRSSGLETDR